MSNLTSNPPVHHGQRHQNQGCWTGWVADMQLIRTVKLKSQPETYLEHYPRTRATALNTWLSRYGIYTKGMFLELDRKGSAMVKDLLKRSPNSRGFMIRVDGVRNGDKLKVVSVREIAKESVYTDPDFQRIAQSQLRGEFAKMGI
jgi:hypothetical protein